ncbi:hypothetical protein THAOC_12342 [Thalassiosira oceanica]|uniref:Uncharacterized protein n=1 Tax=Thalassiosira oceanica TaxID=159749 RepID=K0T8F0_THAOC|nr:hypothetical protein THAOC_12342 [Thalassiosira oceanica]|eukprot:EJK66712.1 hypothetical protein THAOC_12342 [Thalassiosira oceanica]
MTSTPVRPYMVICLPVDLSNPQIRDATVWGGWRGGTTAWLTVVHGSGSDDTTYPPDGVANQDNCGGRTGVCALRTCFPANVNSRLYPMDLTLKYGTVAVFVRMMRMCQVGRRREDEPFSPGQSQYSGGDENKIRFCRP